MLKRSCAFAFAAVLFAGCSNSSTPTAPSRNGFVIGEGPSMIAGGGVIDTFSTTSSGSVAPLIGLTSTSAYVAEPYGILNDGAGNLWVSACDATTPGTGVGISKFPIGASGTASPTLTIAGSNTTLECAPGVALDAAGNVYVSSFNSNSVLAFAAGSSGNVAPSATLSGANTGLVSPFGLFIKNAKLYVTNSANNVATGSIEIFPAGASGNVAPTTTISGAATTIVAPTQIWVDSKNDIWIADFSTKAIDEFAPNASGNVAPILQITGANANLFDSYSVAVDNRGYVYAGTIVQSNPTINVYAPGASGNVAPIQTIVPTSNIPQLFTGLTIR